LLGEAFDKVILFEDHYLRGREKGAIISLFRKGLESANRTKEVLEVEGADNACETALNAAKPGELILMQADTVDGTMQWLRSYLAARTQIDLPESVEEQPTSSAKPKVEGVQTPAPASKTLNTDAVMAEVNSIVKA
jgi:hypothetical protein